MKSLLGLLCLSISWLACTDKVALAADWEVGVIFLGANENGDYQADIDQNILELARVKPNQHFRLTIYREMPSSSVLYEVEPSSSELNSWDQLFFKSPYPGIQIAGHLRAWPRSDFSEETVLKAPDRLKELLAGIFKNKSAKRLLILYGHGLGFEGLQSIKLKDLKRVLEEAMPERPGKPLDILWLDACFMATIEVAYELRDLTKLFMASEDAEFSAGAPFNSLGVLEAAPDDEVGVAKELAERFVESYSFTQKGSQRRVVFKSSATISVIAADRLEGLIESIRKVVVNAGGALAPDLRKRLKKSIRRRLTEREDLVDLGSFLLSLRRNNLTPSEARASIDEVLSIIELSNPRKLKTSPRIAIEIKKRESVLNFGYDNWSHGDRSDEVVLAKLPVSLKPDGFRPGPNKKEWPFRLIKRKSIPVTFTLSPFTAGLNRFDFFLSDPLTRRRIGRLETFIRTQDYVIFVSETSANPLLFAGYTQGMGTLAEKYSGLGVLDPAAGATSLSYMDTDFAAKTGWSGF